MTYPVDDAGNPRIDFVWGHMPLQPNDQRQGRNLNKTTDGDWTVSPAVGSDNLAQGYELIDRNTGDGWNQEISRGRKDLVIYASHEIAASNYEGYPSFIQGAPYDDTIPNLTVPSVIDFDSVEAATTFLQNAGFTVGIVTQTEDGATSGNNNWVKSQTPAPGTLVNQGTAVDLTTYNYVVHGPVTYPIAAMRYNMGMNGMGPVDMIINTRVNVPAVGDLIVIEGNSRAGFNGTASVYSVQNDDSYNTGATKVRLNNLESGGDMDWHTGGTWYGIAHTLPVTVTIARAPFGGASPYATLDNNGAGGRLRLQVTDRSIAYNVLSYSGISAANNGYAGKTLTLANSEKYGMGANPWEAYPLINGSKTVYESSVGMAFMGAQAVFITFDDMTQVADMMNPQVSIATTITVPA